MASSAVERMVDDGEHCYPGVVHVDTGKIRKDPLDGNHTFRPTSQLVYGLEAAS
jgi:hypothetical protein